MTMHLMGHAYSTINKRKTKAKITDKRRRELEPEWHAYNRQLKQLHMPKITFDEYLESLYGTKPKATPKQKVKQRKQATEYVSNYSNYRETPHYPSLGDGVGTAVAPEPKEYSGERKLLGVATMHKSNMVPVFEDDDGKQYAKDLARMRRG